MVLKNSNSHESCINHAKILVQWSQKKMRNIVSKHVANLVSHVEVIIGVHTRIYNTKCMAEGSPLRDMSNYWLKSSINIHVCMCPPQNYVQESYIHDVQVRSLVYQQHTRSTTHCLEINAWKMCNARIAEFFFFCSSVNFF